MLKKLNKMHPSSVGFFQALGVGLYCSVLSVSIYFSERFFPAIQPPASIAIFLFLFVFSAALTGLLVLGYPLYLALKQELKRALLVVSFTLGFALFFILLAAFILTF